VEGKITLMYCFLDTYFGKMQAYNISLNR